MRTDIEARTDGPEQADGAAPAAATPRRADPRSRVLAGMAAAMAENGYRGTQVADVVRHAKVSNRTFYEHFQNKEDCLVALFEVGNRQTMRGLEAASVPDGTWREQIEASTRAYLQLLGSTPAITEAYVLEMAAAGGRAREARRKAHDAFAARLIELIGRGRRRNPELAGRELTPELATVVVGGLHELVLKTIEEGRVAELPDLAPVITDVIWSVVTAR